MTRIDLKSYEELGFMVSEERNDEIRFMSKGQYSCKLWGNFLYQAREKDHLLSVLYKLILDFIG